MSAEHRAQNAAPSAQRPAHSTQNTDKGQVAVPALLVTTPVLFGLLTLLALLPRTLALADFYTIDEAFHWVGRVEAFSAALSRGDWAGTNLTGHPGVTTMWLGSLGRQLALWFDVAPPVPAGGAAYLALLRLPLAVVNSLAVGVGFLLLQRRFSLGPALLAALLWASEPFLVAHGRVLHLDALLTSFLSLSLLSLLAALPPAAAAGTPTPQPVPATDSTLPAARPAWFAPCQPLLLLSGAFAGLALVTKAPSLLLPPLAGLTLLALAPQPGLGARLRWAIPRLLVWLATALLCAALVWPALWVSPAAAIGSVVGEIVRNGGQPHPLGNFFAGRIVADPGPLFYGAVLLFRSSPLLLLGLLLLPLALVRRPAWRAPLLTLLALVLLFTLALTLQPKKFDRYLLPVFPLLCVLAGAGWAAVACWLGELSAGQLGRAGWPTASGTHTQHSPLGASRATRLLGGAVFGSAVFWQLGTLAYFHPYYLAYFNPLLGGGRVAQQVVLVGWGEGMEQVGHWLQARPDLERGGVISGFPPTLEPFVSVPVYDLRVQSLRYPLNYAVLYSSNVQRAMAAETQNLIRQSPPLYRLERYGITYATVHQLPRPVATPRPATFDDAIQLRGFSLQQLASSLTITPSWSISAARPGGVFLFLHLLAPDGTRVAQLDAPLDEGMFANWQPGQQFASPLPLPLPPDLPPGPYRLVLGLYDPASGARLPLSGAEALPNQLDGPEALLLTMVELRPQ